MYTKWDILGALLMGFMVSFGFTPFLIMVAMKLRIVDYPQKNKKAHMNPMPLLGGVAIFLAFFTSVVFLIDVNMQIKGILTGAAMLLCLGLVDDKVGMLPQLKLCVQVLAALVAFKYGLYVATIEDYYLSMFFTVFWIVGITNAFNLLDNLNGLSSGVAAIAALFFCVIAFFNGEHMVAAMAAAIVGACIGFLRYNFPKAQIFMGDSGSLVLGFLLACIAILGSWGTEAITLSIAVPIVILGYPIFDTTLVTIIRLMEKRSIFQGGKDHSSHLLALIGFKKKKAVLIIFCIGFLLGISAVFIKYSPVPFAASVLGVTVMSMALLMARFLYVRRRIVVLKNGKSKT